MDGAADEKSKRGTMNEQNDDELLQENTAREQAIRPVVLVRLAAETGPNRARANDEETERQLYKNI